MNVRTIAAVGALTVIAATGAVVLPTMASASTSGKVSFLISESSVGGHDSAVAVLHGAINSGGKDVAPDNGSVDTLHLAGGTLKVSHPNKDAKFTFTPNAKTCYFSFVGTGGYTLGGGTGKYKGVKGSGKYKVTGSGVAPRKSGGACNFQSDGGVSASYVTGSGPVTLP